MTVEWISPIIGGVLISLSLGGFLLLNGASCSLGDMLKCAIEKKPSVSWNNQILFLLGVLISPLVFTSLFYPINGTSLNNHPLLITLSGLLVGSGFELCNGGIISKATLGCASNPKISIAVIVLILVSAVLTQITMNL